MNTLWDLASQKANETGGMLPWAPDVLMIAVFIMTSYFSVEVFYRILSGSSVWDEIPKTISKNKNQF